MIFDQKHVEKTLLAKNNMQTSLDDAEFQPWLAKMYLDDAKNQFNKEDSDNSGHYEQANSILASVCRSTVNKMSQIERQHQWLTANQQSVLHYLYYMLLVTLSNNQSLVPPPSVHPLSDFT